MLLNYLKLSFRLLIRNPFFTFINVAGLSVGFAVFFILWQYSQSELRSNQQWNDWERIYRLGFLWEYTDDNQAWQSEEGAWQTPGVAKDIAMSMPQVEAFTRVHNQWLYGPEFISGHGKEIEMYRAEDPYKTIFIETNTAYADPNVFEFFGFPLVAGDPTTILEQPEAVAISESVAKKYFGNTDPINKVLIMNDTLSFNVTGVFKDLPRNTHLTFDMLFSTNRLKNLYDTRIFTYNNPYCYVKLGMHSNLENAQSLVKTNGRKFYSELLKNMSGIITLRLEPIDGIPFKSVASDLHNPKNRFFLLALAGISIIVPVMAWINYILLTYSFNRRRAIEFLARRTFGAQMRDLALQFLTESALLNVLALSLTFTLIQLTRGLLDLWFQFYVPSMENTLLETWLILGAFVFTGVMICALVPALSSYKIPMKQKGELVQIGKPKMLGVQGLSVFQFLSAIVLIIFVLTVFSQVRFLLTKDWGIKKDQVVVLDLPLVRDAQFDSQLSSFEKELGSLKDIDGFTVTTNVLGDILSYLTAKRNENSNRLGGLRCNGGVDERFLPFYGIKLLAGRNFLPDNPVDRQSVLVSKVLMERLGFSKPDSAVGQKIMLMRNGFSSDYGPVWIIGVIDDYAIDKDIFKSLATDGIIVTYKTHLREDLEPKRISIRIKPGKLESAMREINSKYSSMFPGSVFNWYFLDDHVNRHFQNEKIMRNQILLFALIAIGIACLGLLGMISYKVIEKTKEIGIRKVLGAQLHQIAMILLNTTIKQVVVAAVVGIPLAYYTTQQYLLKFPERIELQWWHFGLPVVILVTIMFLTISSVLWKAAESNPVEALKYE